MTDYIDRQAAIDAFLTELTKRERKNLLHTWSTVEVKYFITGILEQLPSAEVEPIKHGRWENGRCSICKAEAPYTEDGFWEETAYCPHCGAKMEGAEE